MGSPMVTVSLESLEAIVLLDGKFHVVKKEIHRMCDKQGFQTFLCDLMAYTLSGLADHPSLTDKDYRPTKDIEETPVPMIGVVTEMDDEGNLDFSNWYHRCFLDGYMMERDLVSSNRFLMDVLKVCIDGQPFEEKYGTEDRCRILQLIHEDPFGKDYVSPTIQVLKGSSAMKQFIPYAEGTIQAMLRTTRARNIKIDERIGA